MAKGNKAVPNGAGANMQAPPKTVPQNRGGKTTGFARGAATAYVWAVAHNLAQQGTKPTAGTVYPLCQNVPSTTPGVLAGQAGCITYNTVQTQVGRYNLWAAGVKGVTPPRWFNPGS